MTISRNAGTAAFCRPIVMRAYDTDQPLAFNEGLTDVGTALLWAQYYPLHFGNHNLLPALLLGYHNFRTRLFSQRFRYIVVASPAPN